MKVSGKVEGLMVKAERCLIMANISKDIFATVIRIVRMV